MPGWVERMNQPVQSYAVQYFPALPSVRMDAGELAGVARKLRDRWTGLQTVSLARVMSSIDAVHKSWRREDSQWRSEAVRLIHGGTGYPLATVDDALRRLFGMLTRPEMKGWLKTAYLRSVPPSERRLRHVAFGPRLTVVVASGNIPGAALPAVVQALLLRSPCLVKVSSSEPHLLPLYARSLAAVDPELVSGLAVLGWEGGSQDLERAVLAEAEALIAYGTDATLGELRSLLPVHARFVGYGSRISFAAVGREALYSEARAAEAAARLARDVAIFDQQGCLSPQAAYVELGGVIDPGCFGEMVAGALAAEEQRVGRRPLSAGEASAIHVFRSRLEALAAMGEPVRLWCSPGSASWTVAVIPEAELRAGCLNRTLALHPVASLNELPRLIQPLRHALSSCSLEVGEERREPLSLALTAGGVNRIARLGAAQSLRTALFHDGVDAVAALTRFASIEP